MFIQQIQFATPEYDEIVALRYDVLRQPLGLEFAANDLAQEYKNVHLAAYAHDYTLLGCLMLVANENKAYMRQVAVRSDVQGKGVGRALVDAFEAYARANGFVVIELEARDTAVPFYIKLGYTAQGEPFTKIGILHTTMIKNLL